MLLIANSNNYSLKNETEVFLEVNFQGCATFSLVVPSK